MKNLVKIILIPLIISLNFCPKKASKSDKNMETLGELVSLQGFIIKNGPLLEIYETHESEQRINSLELGVFYYKEFTPITKSFIIKNPGDETTTINSLKIYSDYGEKIESTNFSIDKTDNLAITPGGAIELKVTFTAPREIKHYQVSVFADINLKSYKDLAMISLSADVAGYAHAKCGSGFAAVRVENQESVSKILHLFKEYIDCKGNNTETIPNSVAVVSFGPIPPSSTTEYKCIELKSEYSHGFYLSDGIGGDTGCMTYLRESLEIKNQYKITINSTLMNSHSMTEE